MSIERVKAYFSQYGMEQRILEFDVSSATVELAAQALGVRPARIAKTLSFHIDQGCQLIVTAGDAKIDNGKYKARFGAKARMLSFEEVEPMTGSAVGGVCPFALPAHVPVYLDVSLKRFYTVFPACGSDNSAIELSCQELFQYAGAADWVDVCKDWDPAVDPPFNPALFSDAGDLSDGVITLRLKKATGADEKTGWVPAYDYQIVRASDGAEAGGIDLRVGYTRNTFFGGNVGYQVEEAFRGNGYAARAVRLLLPLAARHGMPCVRIACAPGNEASKATAVKAGGVLEKTVEIPSYASLYREGVKGEHEIYKIDLTNLES
jgi:prolyl-tRNA editing enzyme YbaK/EbsC (Cys-tRNA(Pro) deacylase)/predicted acetyltransferase